MGAVDSSQNLQPVTPAIDVGSRTAAGGRRACDDEVPAAFGFPQAVAPAHRMAGSRAAASLSRWAANPCQRDDCVGKVGRTSGMISGDGLPWLGVPY